MAMGDKSNLEFDRVGVYIDGFNLYYGLRELAGRRLLWLDLWSMSVALLRPGQRLVSVRYFTAAIRDDPPAMARQGAYMAAVASQGVEVVMGRYQEQVMRCRSCGASRRTYTEKQSDVALATAMVGDVATSQVDVVLLVSADSDLCAAIHGIRRLDERRGRKTKVVAVFPPERRSNHLRKVSDAWFPIGAAVVRRSQFPDVVHGRDGAVYHRPPHWN
ncbi:NYN domain-containing protein [Nonomuraea sp. NPDC026600]|uniref:NYN domain-containing protein n=1 Tax=Nonomuraea sp. NPDC026600 TaxID=3155363 RepID=UPI0033E50198